RATGNLLTSRAIRTTTEPAASDNRKIAFSPKRSNLAPAASTPVARHTSSSTRRALSEVSREPAEACAWRSPARPTRHLAAIPAAVRGTGRTHRTCPGTRSSTVEGAGSHRPVSTGPNLGPVAACDVTALGVGAVVVGGRGDVAESR